MKLMDTEILSNILAINIYFETLSKKEQIKYLKSLDIDTTDLEDNEKGVVDNG